ncbi:hypothetical protein B9Q03_02860 [Candidatus Marsarchaeota G2 archaeon OSP_D]|uniref:Uncharacterized protein n=5 Tax=Candidatus Marsarchaeota group 2 TaxID=2203771 RepID=A0A2R6C6Y5_9ARCH|nr:MAG: hypothetical protein B9Q03_02860 [Candidatus Marsarchaeota G2 archaeon OSP_D]PSN95814.1 MAG: hypothetical protein B9Q06_04345 [Candidatus Marsarchaeota G2 archaeon ECH_B_2]PSO00584.1 MAG: hypothetical protein B9Q07_03175 [Candidatus Marsarchaeota G2 archaeon ECH_B_3]PSO03180.1 MAG: hypothetical protein B9Q05_02220 [Candidatus Marsarchaeota G2 archaeon ECH_B_1]PSO06672.1 MAG: hypothetical protein B9Q04_14865 [Candidatus Marsarchaeota G2 archaeon BE_D]
MVGATKLNCDPPWSPLPTDIFSFFRNLNVFGRNRKRFGLRVLLAVSLYAFGLSLREENL